MNDLVMARLQKNRGGSLSKRHIEALKAAGEYEEPKKDKKAKKTEVKKVKQAVSKKQDAAVKSDKVTKG